VSNCGLGGGWVAPSPERGGWSISRGWVALKTTGRRYSLRTGTYHTAEVYNTNEILRSDSRNDFADQDHC